MRKLWLLFTATTFLFLVGCVNQEHVETTKSLIQWAINEIEVTNNQIHLVESHPDYDATFEWTIDQPDRIDFTQKLLIPTTLDTTVLLTITVSYKGIVLQESTPITIYAIAVEDKQGVATEIANWMIEHIVVDGSNITLPSVHPTHQASVSWQTEDTSLIDIEQGRLKHQTTSVNATVTVVVVYKTVEVTLDTTINVVGVDTTAVANQFINQFFQIINRNYNVKTSYTAFGGTNITWESSNPEYFSNEGIYQAPLIDMPITIYYTVNTTNPSVSISYEKNFTVLRMTNVEREAYIKHWLTENLSDDGVLDETVLLPTSIGVDHVTLSWFDANQTPVTRLSSLSTYIIPNVGVDLMILVTIQDYSFEVKVRYQTLESNLSAKMRQIRSIDLVKEMKVGWNLGNTFDSPSETAWGNPKTTKAMIDKVKAAGFNVLRIPVTWQGHFSETGDYTIDEAWMSRVQEVINYAIDGNTFVILNMHHERWNSTSYQNKDRASLIMEKLWTQVATRFANYDEHLIFEGMNEPRIYEASASIQWSGNAEAFSVINHLNQVFVNTVRSLGGNNQYRHLMITTNGAGTSEAILSNLVVPNDPYVIVSVHAYSPYDFAHDKTTVTTWSASNYSQTNVIDSVFNRLNTKFIQNDIAVIMGEFASRDKANLSSRLAWLEYYLTKATAIGIPCVWWDTGQVQTPENMTFSIFNRNTRTWLFPQIVHTLMEFSR